MQWGERLFYPPNRIVRSPPTPRLDTLMRRKAAVIRGRIEATVSRRAPQVMVKVTGGGRGMKAIAAHFRYISKNGRLEIEDERGETMREARTRCTTWPIDWRFGGALIDEVGHRREAFNIMLSMPRGTDPLTVQRAAREFAQVELADHKYVMVLHDHQANPHVHISVRAESQARQAAESAQGRPAPLARDLRREAARATASRPRRRARRRGARTGTTTRCGA